MSTSAEQCVPGPHMTLKILPPSLVPPVDPSRLFTNLTFASEHIVFGF